MQRLSRSLFHPHSLLFMVGLVCAATSVSASPTDAPFLTENNAAMTKMMAAMDVKPTECRRYAGPLNLGQRTNHCLAREAEASRTGAIHRFGGFLEAKRPQEVLQLVVGHAFAYRREEGACFLEPIR